MKTHKTLAAFSAVLALASSAFAGSAMADEASGYEVSPPAFSSTVSRAEVEADRNLWLQAGMAAYAGTQADRSELPGYAASAARYQASRNGPAYFAELRRLQGTDGAALASRTATEARPE